MKLNLFRTIVLTVFLLIATLPVFAWWDTALQAQRPIPLTKEFEAEQLSSVPQNAIVSDAQANGGQNGKAVLLTPSSNIKLNVEAELAIGTYALWAIARPEAEFDATNRQAAFFTLDLVRPDGVKQSWTMPVTYVEHYEAIAQLYFPVDVAGKYQLSMSLDPQSKLSFLVDRLELRDALANTVRIGVKSKAMLFTPQEREQIRAEATKDIKSARYNASGYRNVELPVSWPMKEDAPTRTPEQRRTDADKIWEAIPDFNTMTDAGIKPFPWMTLPKKSYSWIIGRDRNGFIRDGADLYHKYSDHEAAWDAAVMLAGLAYKYPALDMRVQGTDTSHGITNPAPFGFSGGQGKYVYSGWAPGDLMRLATAYDQLFDYIKDNQPLADFLGSKIAWVKTPQDVIKLLDVYLLQSGADANYRRQLRSEELSAFLPLVLGPSEVSDHLLEQGLFSKVHGNMADAGGIDDQIFTAYSRDGVRYIGSVLYIGDELKEIANLTHQYVAAGGDPKFDLLDAKRYPQIARARGTIEATSVAGGFPLVVGDARDLHVGRIFPEHAAFPSRVLGGFGLAILEDGQHSNNLSAKRAVAVRTGLGVGHAQQDTLNLDITALGARLAPDLGGRHEGHFRGEPNMRWNRVHNLVEVDEKNFENIVPGSTTSGTGWTRLFSPTPGSQVMINAGRATSHPNVSLYERTTAMIDGPLTDELAPIYVFDVFRVGGGKTHTYAFHGAESQKFETNATLQPAHDADALEYLRRYKEGTRQQGKAPGVLQADWELRDEMATKWLGQVDENGRRHTRLSLFGHEGDDVLVGNAHSDHYKYDFPFLHVQKRGEEGLQSVYPAIIETYAGEPFIASQRALKVTPTASGVQQSVAVEVVLKSGRRDLLFAGGDGKTAHKVEGGVTAAGEFGFISEDANGLRALHLAGGTLLQKGKFGIIAQQAEYSGALTKVDEAQHNFEVNASIPPAAAIGEVALLGNAQHSAEFNLQNATTQKTGTEITTVGTPQFYQSPITHIDPKTSSVVAELEPTITRADPHFYDGAIAGNEAGDKFWKAKLTSDERWMNVSWPGYRTSWPNRISMADIPDSDGDGKHELQLIGNESDKEKNGKLLLTLNVTRVSDDGQTLYFEMPKEEEYQAGGWQYAYRTLVNEDGSQTWRALYPGTSYRFVLEGPPVTPEAFADANGDGKRKLKIYHYGPGSQFTLPTHVAVTRTAPGEWEVRTNVESTLMLPGKGKVQIKSADGDWKPLKSQQKGDVVTVKITRELLSDKPLRLKLEP
jgi:hypothetical protein